MFKGDLVVNLEGDSKGDFKQGMEGDLLSSLGPVKVWFRLQLKLIFLELDFEVGRLIYYRKKYLLISVVWDQ